MACGASFGTSFSATHWLNRDSVGLSCAAAVHVLILLSCYVLKVHLLQPWLGGSARGALHSGASFMLLLLALVAHVRAVLTDPGSVPKDAAPRTLLDTLVRCRRCDAFKPPRAHHCSICKRCITKMDHHCPWINNCVGVGNHKFFILFVAYIALSSAHALALVAAHAVGCLRHASLRAPAHCTPSPGGRVLLPLLVLECVLFGIFTFCLAWDQMTVALTNMTAIDRLKKERPLQRGGVAASERASGSGSSTRCANLREVFGVGRCSPLWLLPLAAHFPECYWQRLTGYAVAGRMRSGALRPAAARDLEAARGAAPRRVVL
jgi:palmitoyltransferase